MRGRRQASAGADASGADANANGTAHTNACAKARAARRRRCATTPAAHDERTAPHRRRRRVQQQHAHACVMNSKWTQHSFLAFREMRVRLLGLLSVRSSSSPLLPLSLLPSYLPLPVVAWTLVDAAGTVPRIRRVRIDRTAACRHRRSWSGGSARTRGDGREAAVTSRRSQTTRRHGWHQRRLRMLRACARPSYRHETNSMGATSRVRWAGLMSASGLHGASLAHSGSSVAVSARWWSPLRLAMPFRSLLPLLAAG